MGEAKRRALADPSWSGQELPVKSGRSKIASVLEDELLRGGEILLMEPGSSSGGSGPSVKRSRLAQKLEMWRKRAGLTKVQAARVFGVDVLTWYRWIDGVEPSARHLVQLVKVLHAAVGTRKRCGGCDAPLVGKVRAGQVPRIGEAGKPGSPLD